jgi:hypothetical protein
MSRAPKVNPDDVEENFRQLLNMRARLRSSLRKQIEVHQNFLRFANKEAVEKKLANYLIDLNMALNALTKQVVTPDMSIIEAASALQASMEEAVGGV